MFCLTAVAVGSGRTGADGVEHDAGAVPRLGHRAGGTHSTAVGEGATGDAQKHFPADLLFCRKKTVISKKSRSELAVTSSRLLDPWFWTWFWTWF